MLTKTITIDGREVPLKASAAIPRYYRFKFRRDIIIDMNKLIEAYNENQNEGKEFDVIDLELFENVAYIMAKYADPDNVPNKIDEWLDGFNVFSIYEILPEIVDLWGLNIETQIESKKKLREVAAGN